MLRYMPQLAMDPELRVSFGARLRELRKKFKLSLKDVGQKLGIRYTHVIKYESGVHAPPLEKIIQLADLYQVSLDYLATGRDYGEMPIKSPHLLERFRAIESAPLSDQSTVVSIIDALMLKNQITQTPPPAPPLQRAS